VVIRVSAILATEFCNSLAFSNQLSVPAVLSKSLHLSFLTSSIHTRFRQFNLRGAPNGRFAREVAHPQLFRSMFKDKTGLSFPRNVAHPSYCAASVNVTMGCPSANCPSALTCTVPGTEGRVSTTAALPEEFVVTVRLESEPAVALKKIVPPAALPPDWPALSVTDRFSLLPARPF